MSNCNNDTMATIDIDPTEQSQLPEINTYYKEYNEMKRANNHLKNGFGLMGTLLVSILVITCVAVRVSYRNNHSTYVTPNVVKGNDNIIDKDDKTTEGISPIDVACRFLGYSNLADCLLTTEYDNDVIEYKKNESMKLINTIPTEIGLLKHLQKLSFNKNTHLEGTLPTELGLLTNLIDLKIQGIGLIGTIPETIGKLSLLQSLRMDNNNFTGTIPNSFGLLSNLLEIDLSFNQLNGTIPYETFANWTQIRSVWLQNNYFTGSIPSSLGTMEQCKLVVLSENQLSGSIPNSMGNMTELQVFLVHNNQLTGTVPHSMNVLQHLERLWFANNTNMDGTIPTHLQGTLLNDIDFTNTNLYGTIPNIFCRRFHGLAHYIIDCPMDSITVNQTTGMNTTTPPKIYCNCCQNVNEIPCPNSIFTIDENDE
jgi:hypothetical protein